MFTLFTIAEEMARKKQKVDHAFVLKEYDVDLTPSGVHRLKELIEQYTRE